LKVTVEHPSESEAVLNVELEWAELEKASDRAYQRLAQKHTVHGFRRGHAPRSIIERMVGKETVYQEGLEDLIESTYRDAIRQHSLTPLSQPELTTPSIEMGQPYTYTAHVTVLPPVKLGDYQSLRVEQPDVTVTEQDVDELVERIRQDQAMWLPVERPAQLGDKVTVDLKLVVGERTVSDLHDNEFELADERAGIFSGMDAYLVGMSEAAEGEEAAVKEFTTIIPQDYANTELAGKEAHYTVILKGVKHRELPAVDDELAKAAGSYETVDALRAAIHQQLESQRETEARRKVREDVLKAVTDASQVETPAILVSDEVNIMLNELRRSLENSHISLEQYLEMMQKSEEQYREELAPEATERVKRELVLDAVADAEQFTVTDRELENWLQVLAMVGGQRRRLRDLSAGQRASLAGRLRRDKAAARLVESATAGPTGQSEAAASGEATSKAAGEANAKAAALAIPTPGAAVDEGAASEAAAKAATPATEQPEQPAARSGKSGKVDRSSRSSRSSRSGKAAAQGTEETVGEPLPESQASVSPPAETDV